MKPIVIACILAAGLGFGAVAASAADTPAPCAFTKQVDHFKPIDDYTAVFDTSPTKKFKVTFYSKCDELEHSVFAKLEGKSGVCVRQGDVLVVRRPGGIEDRCTIKSIEALPTEPAAATPPAN